MVDGTQGHGREVRRRAARPRSRATIGLRAVERGRRRRSDSPSRRLFPTLRHNPSGRRHSRNGSCSPPVPPGYGVEQIFRITAVRRGSQAAHERQLCRRQPPRSRPNGKRIAFARVGSRNLQHEPRWDGRPPPDDQRPRQASPPGLRTASRSRLSDPAANGWGVHVMSASGAGERRAPPGASRRPAVLDDARGLLIPTEGDLARIDPKSGRVFQRFGATIDAIVGMNATVCLARSVARSRLSAPDRRIPATRTAVRASPVRGSRSTSRTSASTRRRAFSPAMPDRRRSRPTGSDWRSWPGTGSFSGVLANGTSKTIKTGKVFPTVATPPVWQPR